MSSVCRSAITVMSLMALSLLAAPPPAHAQKAAFVRDVDGPSQQPVQFALCGIDCAGSAFAVPAGKRLVIQYVSWRNGRLGFAAGVGLATTVGGVGFTHYIPSLSSASDFIGGQMVFITADPGTSVVYQSAGAVAGNIVISGYYVNVP